MVLTNPPWKGTPEGEPLPPVPRVPEDAGKPVEVVDYLLLEARDDGKFSLPKAARDRQAPWWEDPMAQKAVLKAMKEQESYPGPAPEEAGEKPVVDKPGGDGDRKADDPVAASGAVLKALLADDLGRHTLSEDERPRLLGADGKPVADPKDAKGLAVPPIQMYVVRVRRGAFLAGAVLRAVQVALALAILAYAAWVLWE